jgi:acylphosphatase
MERKQAHLIVHGRVQGVFFRESTRREAARLGLTGSVRNRPDGSVEVVAVGDEEALTQLIAWAHRGPPAARVDRVELTWDPAPGEFPDFTVAR